MKIAVASGKGGTGKTTVSVSLAQSVEQPVYYLDCDVEEPNGDLFLHPEVMSVIPSTVLVPEVDIEKCNGCGDCAELCQFNAIVSQGEFAIIFPELCHSCGGCRRVCPHDAITEIDYQIGEIKTGQADHIKYIQGKLDIGISVSSLLIKDVIQRGCEEFDGLMILDCPPGTACPMVGTVREADFVLLVTEPTPFGLHDLKLAVETVRELDLPFSVIINRYNDGNTLIDDYCAEEAIDIALVIPESREIATASSDGHSLISVRPDLKENFVKVLKNIEEKLAEGACS